MPRFDRGIVDYELVFGLAFSLCAYFDRPLHKSERVLELLKEQGSTTADVALDAYAIVPDAASLPVVTPVLQTLRSMGISVQMHAPADSAGGMGSMKSQFKKADASGARFALIFGSDELAQSQVTIKALRDGEGAQSIQSLQQIADWGHSLQSTL